MPHPTITSTFSVTTDQVMSAKRVVVVLGDVLRIARGHNPIPMQLRADLLVLTELLNRLEQVAAPPPAERGFLGRIAHEVANLPPIISDDGEVR